MDRIVSYIGSYFVSLNGDVDALVFAGGIGEKSTVLRKSVVEKVACLGFAIDVEKNEEPMKMNGEGGVVADISVPRESDGNDGKDGKRRKVLVCWTDEQVRLVSSFLSFLVSMRSCSELPPLFEIWRAWVIMEGRLN